MKIPGNQLALRMPRALRRTQRALQRIQRRSGHPAQQHLDHHLDPIRQSLEARVRAMAIGVDRRSGTGAVDRAAIESAIDDVVDSYLADWLTGPRERREEMLQQLDRLKVDTHRRQAMAQANHDEETSKLADLDAAVAHALELLRDPDSPIYEPVPRQRQGIA